MLIGNKSIETESDSRRTFNTSRVSLSGDEILNFHLNSEDLSLPTERARINWENVKNSEAR